jgi:hypothetical protein
VINQVTKVSKRFTPLTQGNAAQAAIKYVAYRWQR